MSLFSALSLVFETLGKLSFKCRWVVASWNWFGKAVSIPSLTLGECGQPDSVQTQIHTILLHSNTFFPLALPCFCNHPMWCLPGKNDRVIHYLAAGAASEGPMAPVSTEKSASGAFLTAGSQTTMQGDCDWWEMRYVQGTVLCEVWDLALEVHLPSAHTRGVTEFRYTRPVAQC